jgi:hypothetical protein
VIDPRDLPARPPSEVEWEELLVKLEIAPRAIRVAVEDAADSPALHEIVRRAALMEHWWGERLEDLRAGRSFSLEVAFAGWSMDGEPPNNRQALEVLAAERERNFGKLQRRGLEVWEWRSELVEGHPLTAYQFAQLRAAADAEVIRSIRALPRG